MSDVVPIRTALISVSDKMGLADLAAGLQRAGVRIYSTGGTRKHLEQSGIDVLDVAEYTGFPEMLDGRVKTLHPKIFGGILAIRDRDDHMDAISDHEIEPFDLVVVNLYPFAARSFTGRFDACGVRRADRHRWSQTRAGGRQKSQ